MRRLTHRAYRITEKLWSKLNRFATFPQTGVSLRQMVQFGRNPNSGTMLIASSFLQGMCGPYGVC